MDNKNKGYRRFIEPPYEMDRIACCLNAIIEIFELSTEKLNNCSLLLIGDAVMEITQKAFSPFAAPEFLSLLIQDIINERCKDEATFNKVLALSEHKYHNFIKTKELN